MLWKTVSLNRLHVFCHYPQFHFYTFYFNEIFEKQFLTFKKFVLKGRFPIIFNQKFQLFFKFKFHYFFTQVKQKRSYQPYSRSFWLKLGIRSEYYKLKINRRHTDNPPA